MTTASVVVNNFNYGRYVAAAIDSALAQTHPATEVIVVDDGSTDDSRDVIAGYGDRVRAVLKDNGGQGSAFNAGFAASTGEVVCFLDADDVLDTTAIARAAEALALGAAKAHWPLRVIDEHGRSNGALRPESPLAAGDLRDHIAANGSESYTTVPTSGNAWARWALEHVLPLDGERYRLFADGYLCTLVPLYGPVVALDEPLGGYRVHTSNLSRRWSGCWIEEGLRYWRAMATDLETRCCELGLSHDPERWRRLSWYPRAAAALAAVRSVAHGDPFVLVDDTVLAIEPDPSCRPVELI